MKSGTPVFGYYEVGINFIDQGGLTMLGAVEKLLGLKLEGRKLPMAIIVIDHVERLAEH